MSLSLSVQLKGMQNAKKVSLALSNRWLNEILNPELTAWCRTGSEVGSHCSVDPGVK